MKFVLFAFLPCLAAGQHAPVAKTLNGSYVGRYLPEFSQDLFLGIPYARSPILGNPLPWNETWKGTRSAEYYGSICHSGASAQVIEVTNVTGKSAECLNLNIIRPSEKTLKGKKKLPVAVWLYGGAFGDGFGADLNSNYSWFVQESVAQNKSIIAITLNYRVGFLGFPGGDAAAKAGITNLGLKDQRQALRWIQENIEAFGGDPKKVTVWGQSAGAQSIAYQLMAYGGKSKEKLFHQGIMVSSSVGMGNTVRPSSTASVEGYRHILNATNCLGAQDELECLRKVPIDDLWKAAISIRTIATWWPAIDGDFVHKPPTLSLLAGEFSRDVSILAGTASDEGFSYTNLLSPGFDTDEELYAMLRARFHAARNESIQELMRLYPVDAPSPPYALPISDTDRFCTALKEKGMKCGAQYRRVAAILGDFGLLYGRRVFANKFAELGLRFYSYRFDTWPTSFPITDGDVKPGFSGHGSDYSYWFGWPREYELYGNNPPIANGSSHEALQKAMTTRLISYISTGNPNSIKVKEVPEWPPYSIKNPSNIVFNATETDLNVHIEPDTWRKEGMAFWARYATEFDLAGSLKPGL
ncbi:Alpha/Beta hydrolase protein [Cercophora newfieldiana]|uniref:Carboxylic ester hydrolase n=1 Tax=Cercophora newfieldiana TaxID=92897 RepID=A0AA39YUP2_9PEZI|nr:Alpha/Beta hydrolase protein [Cercophora newfieldiana]